MVIDLDFRFEAPGEQDGITRRYTMEDVEAIATSYIHAAIEYDVPFHASNDQSS